ncbi:MAG: hypothetical protein RLZZ437_584 [Pseudomonadota bacterium]|jgi:uncharacterized protein (DUF1499 family)
MKKRILNLGLFIAFAIIALLGAMAFVRLAPTDPTAWQTLPTIDTAFDTVTAQTGGATLRLSTAKGAPADLLARLDAIAMATPRTTRLAQTDGRIIWETRSALWGFPDYTTAEVRADGLYIHARLRFGSSDLGVNAARLNNWLGQL